MIFSEESYQILGVCFEVYKEKGCGFLEAVYQECLEIEFGWREIPFVPRRIETDLRRENPQTVLPARFRVLR